jgi:hypothetical protein
MDFGLGEDVGYMGNSRWAARNDGIDSSIEGTHTVRAVTPLRAGPGASAHPMNGDGVMMIE